LGLQSKFTVYAAIVGVFAMMGGIVFYASLDNPHLEEVEIELVNVEVIDINAVENSAKLTITFLIKNPSDKTLTVPIIDYQLFANESLLGSGQYSTSDIAMPGRAIFPTGAEIPLKNTFLLNKSDVNSELYESVINNQISSFSAEGIITAETAWSLIEKEFITKLN